jgi:myo-inositol 2-dehydrogenase/D-chiro-inositol 1-dehydrogenase
MRSALLGAGKMGSFHAETLRAQRGVEVRIYDVDPARRTVPGVSEALDGADAAVIATPAATHADLIRACVGAGLPTFCEKPIAIGLEETLAVARQVTRHGRTVQIGFQRRFDSAFRTARDRFRAGELGRLHGFAMATFDRVPPPHEYLPASGGLFRDMHIHDFDTIRWMFGCEVSEVTATGSVLVDPVFQELGDVDTSAISVRLSDGSLGTLVGGRANAGGYVARLDIYGAAAMHSLREDRAYHDFLDRYASAYRAEIEHFLLVAQGKAESACTAGDALQAIRIAEAAERSLRERRSVALREVPDANRLADG